MLSEIFVKFLQQYPIDKTTHKWLVAVSGGVDSVVLCYLCKRHDVPFAMAHCNFQLRDAESERDFEFVQTLARTLEVELFTTRFDTKKYMAEQRLSVQVAARQLRYEWFQELLMQPAFAGKKAWIVTGHHANDNVETVLMNLFRGTGLKGMRGIMPVHGNIVRPLLGASREMIMEYATGNQLQWVEDSSNSSDKYTRNLVRNQIMPIIEKAIPRAELGFEKTLQMMQEAELLYNEAVQQHKQKLVIHKNNEVHIPVLKLAKSKPLRTLTWEIIKDFDFSAAQTDEVLTLLDAASGKYVASASHRIIRNRAWLIIAPVQNEEATHILIEAAGESISFEQGTITLQKTEIAGPISTDANMALLDAGDIVFPLILRPWKTGDYFYPLGMRKKKKLARFFIDHKLSKTDKEKAWVLESNKKILWIVGLRIDDRFKVTDSTKAVLKVEFSAL